MAKVLVGDTEWWALDLFAQAAASLGVELHVAHNGVEAVELFKSVAPDLVVLDTLLPKLDGLKVVAKLREMELGRVTPVVVTSAIYRRGPDIEPLRQGFGFDDFLEKPFRLADVEELLKSHLREERETAAADDDLGPQAAPWTAPAGIEIQLGELGVATLLCQLHRSGKSGILTLRRGEITKTVLFLDGQIAGARSNSSLDHLGSILVRRRLIHPEDCERARRLQAERSGQLRLGEALVELGAAGETDIAAAAASQVLHIVFNVVGWCDGSYNFLETRGLPAEASRHQLNTPNVIFWGLRRLEGKVDFGRFLPPGTAAVERTEGWERLRDALHLTWFEEQMMGLVEGRRRLGEIVSLGRLAQVDVDRVLFSFLLLGVLQVVDRADEAADRAAAPARVVASKGQMAETSVARLFSRLYLGGASATVTLSQGGVQAEVFFDRGQIVYARSNREEHRLGSILLRAGKVTTDDYERAAKLAREQSQRKIGSIFLELRALSLEELDWALRFQVQTIALDLFDWRTGEFEVVAGEPPADCMIALDGTTPNLILEGARSAAPPPAIARLLLAADTMLWRASGGDDVLRQLRLSAAERRLLDYIAPGRTVGEVHGLELMTVDEMARALHGLLALELVKVAHAGLPFASAQPAPAAPATAMPAPSLAELEHTNALDVMAVLGENHALRLEKARADEQLRAAEQRLEALKAAFVRYWDLREGRGAGLKALQRILGQVGRGRGHGGDDDENNKQEAV